MKRHLKMSHYFVLLLLLLVGFQNCAPYGKKTVTESESSETPPEATPEPIVEEEPPTINSVNVAMGKPVTALVTGPAQYVRAPTFINDNDISTFAYSADVNVDYEIDFGQLETIVRVNVVLGTFGTNNIYINSWRLDGTDSTGASVTLGAGGDPGISALSIAPGIALRKIRFRASSNVNWFGVYELKAYAEK